MSRGLEGAFDQLTKNKYRVGDDVIVLRAFLAPKKGIPV